MCVSVDLNDESGMEADKVGDVVAYQVLPAEFQACEPPAPEDRPHPALGGVGVRS
jgi:hypothetical protein